MRLSKIKLAGFKSFVDPTTIHFPSNLVGIVGPNGCGKSNTIDAVRWVMGESSAKNLRGESMSDVIFNGSTGRKPVGQAGIELVFDNSDGGLGGQYAQYAEISIKRQVSRDGQSAYFLNGARCRRRDITDIFLGTGLGPRSYSIIEQGMISRLIEARPEDLRVFLEEARLESELRHVEETRQRLEFQHAERRTQLASWREQRAQLTQALHLWAGRAGGARERLAEARARSATEREKLPAAEQAFRAAQEQQTEARSQLLRAESRLQLEQANLAHVERARQALEQRRERLAAEQQSLQLPEAAALEERRRRRDESDAAVVEAESALEGLQRECEALETARATAAAGLSTASHEHAAAVAQLSTLEQIQAAAEDNAPLQEWLARNGLGGLPRLWQQVRIEPGWDAAVESVLRERLHALDVGDAARLDAVALDVPPVKAAAFSHGAAAVGPVSSGFEPLAAKVHAASPALAGALSDWLAHAYACDGTPAAGERAQLPPGVVLVSRTGHQFTRHTVAFHAPDPADAGLVARQAEIEALQGKVGELERRVEEARARNAQAEAALAARQGALEAARDALAERQQSRHELQIELLKLQQAEERYRERSAQIGGALADLAQEAEQHEARRAQAQGLIEGVAAEIAAARERLESLAAAYAQAEGALVAQRNALQAAERDAQDAAFGERECTSKIAEIDSSVRVIDQQIERADAELTRLNEELAVDPVPAVRAALADAVEARIAREKVMAEARNAVEDAAAALRALEEERLQAESRLAPIRERINELRLKEQAAQINRDQFDGSCARRARTTRGWPRRPSPRRAPRRCRARSRD
jgi:chromosome segregation protein